MGENLLSCVDGETEERLLKGLPLLDFQAPEEEAADASPGDDDSVDTASSQDTYDQSDEPLRSGDAILYYSPHRVFGDPRARCFAMVLSVRPSERDSRLVLSTGDVLPDWCLVRRMRVVEEGQLVAPPAEEGRRFRSVAEFQLEEGGTATHADAVREAAQNFRSIFQRLREDLQARAEQGDFACFMDAVVAMGGGEEGEDSDSE